MDIHPLVVETASQRIRGAEIISRVGCKLRLAEGSGRTAGDPEADASPLIALFGICFPDRRE